MERTADKNFPQSRWDKGKRSWIYGKPDGPKIPYFLPTLIEAPAVEPVFICEGEKDAEAVIDFKLIGTCTSESYWTDDLYQ